DAADLVDLLRLGRLAEAWVAPPAVRELRELVRYRAKLVHLRTSLKAQVHAVLAKEGVPVRMSDLFGVLGSQLLADVELAPAYRERVDSLRVLLADTERELHAVEAQVQHQMAEDRGFHAILAIEGVGP